MQTNPAVEQSKIIRWSESPCNQSGSVTDFGSFVEFVKKIRCSSAVLRGVFRGGQGAMLPPIVD